MRTKTPRAQQAKWLETPEMDELIDWMNDSGCEATDGCWVEPDGWCEHGNNSWLIEMGMI